ncbi:MAG: nitroreductase family protein [Ruminococcus sp.]|jgi:nitroreductase
MDLVQGIKKRRSVRKFSETPVPREILREIIETASWAPSWKNTQTVRYIVVDSREVLKKIASEDCMMGFTHNVDIVAQAPALVILASVKGRSGYERNGSFSTAKGSHWESFDAGIAAQTFCLAACEKGLGTVIMGIFDENKIREIIEIPEDQQISALISIGYPAEEPKTPPRKNAEDLLTFI